MQKKRIMLLIVAVFIIALSAFAFFGCNKNESSHILDLDEGSYPSLFADNYLANEKALMDLGLDENATEEQLRTAVLTAYNVANRSRRTANTSLMIQHTYTTNGTMLFNGFEIKSGNAWYYQLPTEWTPDALKFEISYTTVAYSFDSETYYFAHLDGASNPNCDGLDVFPYATFILTEEPQPYDYEEYRNEHRFCLDDQFELCNMKMSLDLIDASSEITHNDEKHFYSVKLVIDCTKDKDTLKEWYMQAMLEGNKYAIMEAAKCKSRSYDYWYAEIEIWDNGYVKSLNYYEKWDSNSAASSEAVSNFVFFYHDDEIMAILKADPKYVALSDEEKELMVSPSSFVQMYCNTPISEYKRPLGTLVIFGIVVGCVAFAVIVIVVGIEVALKCGKLPKLAAQREAQKQKRLAKKAAKKGNHEDAAVDPQPEETYLAEEPNQEEPKNEE